MFANAVHLAVEGLAISAMGEVECSFQRPARDRAVDRDAQVICVLGDLRLLLHVPSMQYVPIFKATKLRATESIAKIYGKST